MINRLLNEYNDRMEKEEARYFLNCIWWWIRNNEYHLKINDAYRLRDDVIKQYKLSGLHEDDDFIPHDEFSVVYTANNDRGGEQTIKTFCAYDWCSLMSDLDAKHLYAAELASITKIERIKTYK